MWSGCVEPYFLYLGTSWRWVVGFTPRPLYPQGMSPRYQLDRRLGGPQNWSGRSGEEIILDSPGTGKPTHPGRPASSQSLYRHLLATGALHTEEKRELSRRIEKITQKGTLSCTCHQTILGLWNEEGCDWRNILQVRNKWEISTKFGRKPEGKI
jgi:hypothetical protein